MKLRAIPLKDLGQVSQGITPKRHTSKAGDFYQIVNVSDLEDLCIGKVQGQVQLAVSDISRYQLHENDVVIAIRGAILKSSVVAADLQGSVSNQNTVFFRLKTQEVNPFYLAVLLRSGYFQQLPDFKERQSTITLPAIRVADVRNLKIPLPDLHIQKQLAELFLSTEEAKKVALSAIKIRQNLSEAALSKILEVKL
jgi:restriction endonuclease S subunit